SGRRHTRFSRDWSSDVCSSDLTIAQSQGGVARLRQLVLQLAVRGSLVPHAPEERPVTLEEVDGEDVPRASAKTLRRHRETQTTGAEERRVGRGSRTRPQATPRG